MNFFKKQTPMRLGPWDSFWFGVTLPHQALRLILREKTLLWICLLPVGIALVLSFFVFDSAKQLLHGFFLQTLGTQFAFVGTFLLLVAGAILFSFLTTWIAVPLNDWLAEKVEARANPPLVALPMLSFQRRLYLIWIDFVKTLVIGIVSFFLFLLSWVPLLGWSLFGLNAFLLVFQYLSYPQTRRGIGLVDGLNFLFRHPFSSFGFGLILMVLFSIPGISIFIVPLGVVGGTLLFARATAPGSMPRLL